MNKQQQQRVLARLESETKEGSFARSIDTWFFTVLRKFELHIVRHAWLGR